ncbi:MAG: hypothetical protein EOP82_01105 [Variovorax sp.]|nr:MAG: hypothetical protein EOP82_01105 [Variovorax sp.]
MKLINILTATSMVSLAGCSSLPGWGAKQLDEHDAHHPATDIAPRVDSSKVDKQTKAMENMHQKMMAANTPAERAELMKDHTKAMQAGMMMDCEAARPPAVR